MLFTLSNQLIYIHFSLATFNGSAGATWGFVCCECLVSALQTTNLLIWEQKWLREKIWILIVLLIINLDSWVSLRQTSIVISVPCACHDLFEYQIKISLNKLGIGVQGGQHRGSAAAGCPHWPDALYDWVEQWQFLQQTTPHQLPHSGHCHGEYLFVLILENYCMDSD